MRVPEHSRGVRRAAMGGFVLFLAMGPLLSPVGVAAEPAVSEEVTETDAIPGDGFTYLGMIRPRHAREIESSNWAVGAETMDRDYTIYNNWRNYLGPLGVKKARIQSGWAKTEKEKGKYDWAWLDEIIPDMVAQGVEPWVCLCYGNTIYAGGGGTGLSGGLPSSPEALEAWDAYVGAIVDRYGEYVDEWELWNEPRTGRGEGAVTYAKFAARTAEVIRRRQPQARLMLPAGGAFDAVFAEQVLTWLRDHGKLALANEIIYHPYAYNPDEKYGAVEKLREIVRSFSPDITLRQGENGVPSRIGSFGAVSKYDWNEQRQAKWATRRLLGDLGRDIPSSYFAICDMAYRVRPDRRDSDFRDDQSELKLLINSKGLLEINPDRTIHHAKRAYRAVQHVTALFDDSVERIRDFEAKLSGGMEDASYSIFGYRAADGSLVITLWRASDTPGKRPDLENVVLTIPQGVFRDPVWVDVLSGRVYDIDAKLWEAHDGGTTFTQLPVYDSAVVIAERAWTGDHMKASPNAVREVSQ
ncbi:MAG TPA: hypothetical protein VMY37_07670 [Thermoguttaceae bacterium]|nr:hypothetical protein [Thermoguttaceae bacterium]